MILKDHPERVIWLDFDRAQTYNERSITKRESLLIELEEQMMSQFMKALVSGNSLIAELPSQ